MSSAPAVNIFAYLDYRAALRDLYAHKRATEYANLTQAVGQRHMPCITNAAADAVLQCADGLVCAELEPGYPLCFAGCQSDGECDALTRCEAGACRLRATGLTLTP